MLEARALECVRGDRTLFGGLNFSLRQGHLLRVLGANGAGKTSLLRILCGLRAPSHGEVLWSGKPISKTRDDFRENLVYIGHLNGLKDEFSAIENLSVACRLGGGDPSGKSIMEALGYLGVAHCSHLPVRHLSQGQRRRVALGRLMLSADRPLWILDEPFNALDVNAVVLVEDLLATHAAAGGMVVFTTHLEPNIESVLLSHIDLDLHAVDLQ